MLLIRDIMYCKPGKVRPMVKKLQAMADLTRKKGMPMRIMTDVTAERFWTVVSEFEVKNFDDFMTMEQDDETTKAMGEIMKDYHDLVDIGRREVYRIE